MRSLFLILSLISIGSGVALAQSGRKVKDVKIPTPVVEEQPTENKEPPKKPDEAAPLTAEKNQDYRCTDDGTLTRILEPAPESQAVFLPKEVDTRAVVKAQPKPSYTKEGRRNGVQGYVILKVVLSSGGTVDRVRVVRGLPFGLTENAIRAACKLDFKPAIKDGHPVSQWLTVEYSFRLADSSIFGPSNPFKLSTGDRGVMRSVPPQPVKPCGPSEQLE